LEVDSAIGDSSGSGDVQLNFDMDGALNLPSGNRERSIASRFDTARQASLMLQWSTIAARPAFNASLPR
jgi:hypothetical protein